MKAFSMMMMLGMLGSEALGQQVSLQTTSNIQASSTQNRIQNLVVNGDFSRCLCQASRCALDGNGIVQGWVGDSKVQIGFGSLYNNFLGADRVIALGSNSSVRQQLGQLAPGFYQVAVEYSARGDQLLSNCGFGISLNGNILKTITPKDYSVGRQIIDIQVSNGCIPELKIWGTGSGDIFNGALIKSVHFYRQPSAPINIKPIVIDVNINVPDINIQGPTIQAPSISGPNVNIQAPSISFPTIQPQVVLPKPVVFNPVFNAPDVNIQGPNVIAPTIRPPTITVQEPNVSIPVYQPPSVTIQNPSISVPSIPNINIQQPNINLPQIGLPSINLPSIGIPSVNPPSGQDFIARLIYEKLFTFTGGEVEISFELQATTITQFTNSGFVVLVGGKQVYKISITQQTQIISFVLLNIPAGQHVVAIRPFGCFTDPFFKFSILNLIVKEKVCSPQWSNDLIVNGGFQNQGCKIGSWCIWNQNNFQQSLVPGWIPVPEIQIGTGSVYNSKFGQSKVSELDPNKNTCIAQKVSLKAGTYKLNFDWAAREGTKFSTNGLQVRLNGKVLQTVAPCDYNVHTETVQFNLDADAKDAELQFCGTGTSDSCGTVIDNVKLFFYDKCGAFSWKTC